MKNKREEWSADIKNKYLCFLIMDKLNNSMKIMRNMGYWVEEQSLTWKCLWIEVTLKKIFIFKSNLKEKVFKKIELGFLHFLIPNKRGCFRNIFSNVDF